jgi:hypothetical protein
MGSTCEGMNEAKRQCSASGRAIAMKNAASANFGAIIDVIASADVDLAAHQQVLGHASIACTQRYARIGDVRATGLSVADI